uniref:Uncharacterized protein n=1 Tax=Anguilla anguilla TaxID=7936 RepID=A0A0E9Q258_ANGAN
MFPNEKRNVTRLVEATCAAGLSADSTATDHLEPMRAFLPACTKACCRLERGI